MTDWHERYFNWLGQEIGLTHNPNAKRRHWMLAEQMINTPFTWSVPNDDNRMADGKDLRVEFLNMHNVRQDLMGWECSMLEMLVALCRRLVFQAEGTVDEWFWELLENLNLGVYSDDVYENEDGTIDVVDETLHRVINRTYQKNGVGGLFPLQKTKRDQRKVEIWYQMSAYLLEDFDGLSE